MRPRSLAAAILLGPALLAVAGAARAQLPKKDYLTETEAQKIRDAETPSERMKLFLLYAADRLKKFHYELGRPADEPRRVEMLNSLLNAYTGCIDEAADRIDEARERQLDIRAGLKEMRAKVKDFLDDMQKIAAGGPDADAYKETLEDAIEATRDALDDADKAAKEIAPPPVRRKP
jgi:vacuolar-type H+-ATPase subunit I/STV1